MAVLALSVLTGSLNKRMVVTPAQIVHKTLTQLILRVLQHALTVQRAQPPPGLFHSQEELISGNASARWGRPDQMAGRVHNVLRGSTRLQGELMHAPTVPPARTLIL